MAGLRDQLRLGELRFFQQVAEALTKKPLSLRQLRLIVTPKGSDSNFLKRLDQFEEAFGGGLKSLLNRDAKPLILTQTGKDIVSVITATLNQIDQCDPEVP